MSWFLRGWGGLELKRFEKGFDVFGKFGVAEAGEVTILDWSRVLTKIGKVC